MKRNLVILALVTSVMSSAYGATRDLKHLSFFLPEKKTELKLGFITPLIEREKEFQGTNKSAVPGQYNNFNAGSSELTLGIDFGLFTNFVIGADVNYLVHESKTNDDNAEAKSKGFSDPSLNLAYRYMDTDMTGDLFLRVTPELVDAERAATTLGSYGSSVGTYTGRNRGGHNIGGSMDVTLGTKITDMPMDKLEIGVVPYITYRSEATVTEKVVSGALNFTVDSTNKTDSYLVYGADLMARHYCAEMFYMQGGANIVGPVTTETALSAQTTTVNGVSTVTSATTIASAGMVKTKIPFHLMPKVLFGYMLSTDTALELTGTYDRYDIGLQTVTSSGALSGQARTREYTNLVASLAVRFEM